MMNSPRSNPPFRADHVGSFIRPSYLFDARTQFEANETTQDDLSTAEKKALKEVVALQKAVGIRGITDGEVNRSMFFEGVFDKLEGMTCMPQRPIDTFKPYIPHIAYMYAAGLTHSETIYCSGKIKRTKPFYTEQFRSLKALVEPEEVKYLKITMCSPAWFHQRHGSDQTYDLSVYPNDDAYFDALGVAYRAEIKELYELGCRHIQIDDPTFCYLCNESCINGMRQAGVDPDALMDTYIRAINICIQDRPADLTVSLHMCRGNYKGNHFTEGGYDRIAAKLFESSDCDTFYLEYDNERSGDFSPLKHLPANKTVVLGLVTTKSPKLETVEGLKSRVLEAAQVISQGTGRSHKEALHQLCISPQCGFASTWEGNPGLTIEDQTKKLALLVETAKLVWDE